MEVFGTTMGGTLPGGSVMEVFGTTMGGGTSQAPLLWRSLAPHWGRGLPGTTLVEVFWHLRKTPSLKHHYYEDLRHVGHTIRPGAAMREALGAL